MSQQSTTATAIRVRSQYDQPATEAQISYLRSLLAKCPTPDLTDYDERAAAVFASLDDLPSNLTKREASGMIDSLKTAISRESVYRYIVAGIRQYRKNELGDARSPFATALGWARTVEILTAKAAS